MTQLRGMPVQYKPREPVPQYTAWGPLKDDCLLDMVIVSNGVLSLDHEAHWQLRTNVGIIPLGGYLILESKVPMIALSAEEFEENWEKVDR